MGTEMAETEMAGVVRAMEEVVKAMEEAGKAREGWVVEVTVGVEKAREAPVVEDKEVEDKVVVERGWEGRVGGLGVAVRDSVV